VGWRGPLEPGEFPTLGYQVAEWIESMCVIPDGDRQGQPYRLTDEMLRFLLRFYRLHPQALVLEGRPSAPFVYRGGQLMRAQKWGKSPFGGAICLGEAFGPVIFDGWNAEGEPVGRPHPTPWIQVVATSEEQTDNVWMAIYETASRGPIADIPGIDIGLLDINLPSGGKIEPRSASGRARLGARLTFAVFDESHLMTESNGGVLLATTMKRNIGGMGGRWLETTNAPDPSERSIAQRTQESGAKDVLIDYRPPPHRPDLSDDADALAMLGHVYGDSWWVDRERVLADARDPAVCPTTADAMRFFFNLIEVGVSDAVDATRWDALARPSNLEPREAVALGFDGSRSRDCTTIVAARISDGRWFHLRTWDPADHDDHLVPRGEVDRVMTDAFAAYDVRYLFMDPYRWQEYADQWSGRWPKHVVEFPTNVDRRMDNAVTRFLAEFAADFTHDGHPVLAAHAKAAALANGARRQPRPEEDPSVARRYLKVVKKRENVHIDAFIAGLLASMARGQAIEDGALQPAPAFFGTWRPSHA
jgi:hypothetical protein